MVKIEETLENIERDPDTPQPAGELDIQIKYRGWLCGSNVGAVTKTYLYELGSLQSLFSNLEYLLIRHLSGLVSVKL